MIARRALVPAVCLAHSTLVVACAAPRQSAVPASHPLQVIVEEVQPPSERTPQRVAQQGQGRSTARFIDAPLPQVWSALPFAFADLEIPVNVLAAAEGRIGNSGYRVASLRGDPPEDYLTCGEGADPAGATVLRIESVVRTLGRGTEIRLEVQARAQGEGPAGVPCATDGALERLFLERLERHLRPAGGGGGLLP